MNKTFLRHPLSISVIGSIIGYIFIAIINALIKQINLLQSFKTLAIKFYHISIPESLLLILLFLLIVSVISLNKRLNELSRKCTRKDTSDEKIEAENKAPRKIEPNEEVTFVLNSLANVANRSMSLCDLRHYFERKFGEAEFSHLQILINDLIECGLIQEIEVGEWGEIGYFILGEGLAFLKECLQQPAKKL